MNRGEIYLAALDPVVGREIAKTRPVVIVSNNINNQFAGTVTVLPITSKNLEKIYPFEVKLPSGVGNLPKSSKVKADLIRTIDKQRLVKRVGILNSENMAQIDAAIKIHLGMEFEMDLGPLPETSM
jgi:mRNA interferase MazF